MDFGTSYHAKLAGKPIRAAFTILDYGSSLTFTGSALNADIDPAAGGQGVEQQPVQIRTTPSDLPTQFHVGLAYDLMSAQNNRLTLSSEFIQPSDSDPGFGFGAEYAVNISNIQAALRGNLVEAGFDHRQQRAVARRVLQRERHERRLFLRVVHGRIDGIRMPAVREQVRRFDALDDHIEIDVLVAGIGDLPAGALPGREVLALQVRAEPGAEFLGVRESAPDARARGIDDDGAFDAVGVQDCAHAGSLLSCRSRLPPSLWKDTRTGPRC